MNSDQVQTWFIMENLNAIFIVDRFLSTIITHYCVFHWIFSSLPILCIFLINKHDLVNIQLNLCVYIYIRVCGCVCVCINEWPEKSEQRKLWWFEWSDFRFRQIVNTLGVAFASERQIPKSLIPCVLYAICSWGAQKEYHGNCMTVDTWMNNEKSQVIRMTDFNHPHEKCQS